MNATEMTLEERQQMAVDNIKLAYCWAERFRRTNPGFDRDNLRGDAVVALWRAALAFNPSLGHKFSKIANAYILNDLRWCVSRGHAMKRRATFAEMSPNDIIAPTDWVDTEESVDSDDFINHMLAKLPSEKQQIIVRRVVYGEDQKVVAKTLGISPQRVSQIWSEAMARLREAA